MNSASSVLAGEADFSFQTFQLCMDRLQQAIPELDGSRPILVGVSGGRDSVVLLHALRYVLGWKHVVVAHVNHGLRGEASEDDATWVRNLAAAYDLRFEEIQIDVAELAKSQRCSIETAGRNAREAFFHQLTIQYQTPFVFLAHHADDQAETVLSNLCRGASPKGLRGIKSSQATAEGWIKIRPLLELRRDWINAYVEHFQLQYREDATNALAEVRRNRIRLEALPLLNDIFQREVTPSLIKLTQHLTLDEAYFEEILCCWWQRKDFYDADLPEQLRLIPDFLSLHPALRNRLLHQWLTRLGVADVSQSMVLQIHAMLQPGGPAKINLPKGLHLRRKQKRLWLETPLRGSKTTT